jgi:hypothetical protein
MWDFTDSQMIHLCENPIEPGCIDGMFDKNEAIELVYSYVKDFDER